MSAFLFNEFYQTFLTTCCLVMAIYGNGEIHSYYHKVTQLE